MKKIKIIVFLIYCLFALSMGLTLISCKKHNVKPSQSVSNNNNNNNSNTVSKHSMVFDSAYVIQNYFVADTNTLKLYYDPAWNYDIHIHADGVHGGYMDIRMSKGAVVNGVIAPGYGGMDGLVNYAVYTDPSGNKWSTHNPYGSVGGSSNQTTSTEFYGGFYLVLTQTINSPVLMRLSCNNAHIKIQ